MTDAPRISVVTASYNALDGLCRTVESVAAQTWPNVQHVIVDGGSSDGTQQFLERLRPGVTWLRESDQGIADALNKGIALADGDWVIVLQADDTFVDEESLARAVRHLRSRHDIVSMQVLLTYPEGGSRIRKTRPFTVLTDFRMTNPHQGMFCRRDLFNRIGMFDTSYRIALDYEFLLRAKRSGARLKPVHEIAAVMPATGISTQLDWKSTRSRILEDRRLQARHAAGMLGKFAYALYWPFNYYTWMLKSRLSG